MNAIAFRELSAWRAVAQDLGIEFHAPFALDHAGTRFEYLGLLPEFGTENGMLLMLAYDPNAAASATANGFGFSCVELGGPIEREPVVEMLKDWGWSKSDTPPRWYREV